MLDAVVGAVIVVVATSSLLYSIEVAQRVFDQAGKYPLTECPGGPSSSCNRGEKDLLERRRRLWLKEKGLSADITDLELDEFQDDFVSRNIDKAPDRVIKKNEL